MLTVLVCDVVINSLRKGPVLWECKNIELGSGKWKCLSSETRCSNTGGSNASESTASMKKEPECGPTNRRSFQQLPPPGRRLSTPKLEALEGSQNCENVDWVSILYFSAA
jgi:hypothetical protein